MDQQDQTNKLDDNHGAPSGTSENRGNGETPAGGTANPLEAAAKAETIVSGEPTIAEHINTHVEAIDEQIGALTAKVEDLNAAPQELKGFALTLRNNQAQAITGEIATLTDKKNSILAILENLPEELHSLEARAFAALKHLF